MDQRLPESQDIIEDDRELFVSAEHLGQILAPSSGPSSQLITLREGRPFFSVHRFNDLLASFSAEQLEIVQQENEAGRENLSLRLVDDQGDEVPTLTTLRQDEWALHSTISSEDDTLGGGDDGDYGDQSPLSLGQRYSLNFNRHDTSVDNGGSSELLELHHKNTVSPPLDFAEGTNNFNDATDRFDESTVLSESEPQRDESPKNIENDEDYTQADDTHLSQRYDDTVLRKLRALKLTDMTILNRLLENRSPLALSPLSKTRDEFVHLCTLDNGKVFAIKLLRDLHAHDENLGLATLNDAAVLDRPFTGYQRNELSRILTDIEKTACAQELWSSADLVPESRRDDYLRLIPKPKDLTWKLYNAYDTMGDFKGDLELLIQNVELFHGSFHDATAAAECTVQEIVNRMEESAAVGINDHKETLFLGLIREIALSEGPLPDRPMPRFVLPLGKLYNIQPSSKPPHFCSGFILMDISNPRKAIWLYHNGPERDYLVMLADDVTRWKLNSSTSGGGGLMKGDDHGPPYVRRTKLTKEYRESRINFPPGCAVLFKRAQMTQLIDTIREGWGWDVPPSVDLVTPKKEKEKKGKGKPPVRPVFDGGSVSMRKKRGGYVLDSSDDGKDVAWVPQTEHRVSKKMKRNDVTPTGRQQSGKPPRTV